MPPRQSKRKATKDSASSASKIARVDPIRSASGKAASKTNANVDKFFRTYADSSSDMIEPEGIEKLCSDLKLDLTDVKILMLAWKMKAERQGYFTQDEWQRGLKELKVDTVTKLKKSLPGLEKEVLNPEIFEDFYSYAFRYSLIEDKQKCVDIETACILLDIVLGSQFRIQVDFFKEFLQVQSEYKVINMDQWVNFYRFCKEISFSDFEDYDVSGAWPLILDNFVDWMKEKVVVCLLLFNYNAPNESKVSLFPGLHILKDKLKENHVGYIANNAMMLAAKAMRGICKCNLKVFETVVTQNNAMMFFDCKNT